MNEFNIIEKYFAPLSSDGLKDDAAVLAVPEGHELVVSSDTLNAGTHFLEEAAPADIAHKALRTNLSDLVSMAATPFAYQLNIAFPAPPSEDWLAAFTGALAQDQQEFAITCSGGDTTSIKGPLSISITAMGLVPKGQATARSSAREGDAVVLSGPVGDAYLFLQHPNDSHFKACYYTPQPRLDLIELMRTHVHAAVDISDGLVADLGHICRASNLSASLTLEGIPFSPQARALIEQGKVTPEDLITGGDDYQLLLAVPQEALEVFLKSAPGSVQIGTFSPGEPGLTVFDQSGEPLGLKHTGWSHF